MEAFHTFSHDEHERLSSVLSHVPANPYSDYLSFDHHLQQRLASLPDFFKNLTATIVAQRREGHKVHLLKNCPLDAHIPELDNDDPVSSKYATKTTFVAEAFLASFAALTATPLLAYGSRNNGDFFTDVIAINRFSGQLTGFSDSELVYHNDRTAHEVRADYVSLLGMRSHDEDRIVTGFIDGRDLIAELSADEQAILRRPDFFTHFDVFSKATNARQVSSFKHPILENEHSIRYIETLTTHAPDAPPAARRALEAVKTAIERAKKVHHRIATGDLMTFANQDGLHNRAKVDVKDPERAKRRWLLKTYAFRDDAAANVHAHRWQHGVRGRVAD